MLNPAYGGKGGSPESSINELVDVGITNPQSGDILIYNSDTEEWENSAQGTQGNQNIGYYALLTEYYSGGLPSKTTITDEMINTWTDVVFEPEPTVGVIDRRPKGMMDAVESPYDAVTGVFSLEGLTLDSFGSFRASLAYFPKVDEGELEVRLVFNKHSQAPTQDPFYIEQVNMVMNQGSDRDYPSEPYLSFFVGDTINTVGEGDAGSCKFQVKSTVAGVVKMRALTWYLTE